VSNIIVLSNQESLSMDTEWFEYANSNHFWFNWRLHAALKQFKESGLNIKKKLHVLDIGGGMGILANQIEHSTNWNVDICDLDQQALKDCAQIRGHKFLYNIRDENKHMINKYDIVILYDVLEHIKITESFLKSCIAHLKENGLLLVNVPALQECYSIYDKEIGHYRRYNIEQINNEFSKLEVEVLDNRYWGLSLLPILVLRKFYLAISTTQKNIIKTGFQPPSDLINKLFIYISKIELFILSKPLLGTSLLSIYKKTK